MSHPEVMQALHSVGWLLIVLVGAAVFLIGHNIRSDIEDWSICRSCGYCKAARAKRDAEKKARRDA